MSVDGALGEAGEARSSWQAIDARLNPLRSVHAALTDLRETVVRERDTEEALGAVRSAFEALRGEEFDRPESLRFLTEPVFPDGRTLADEFHTDRDVDPAVAAVEDRLAAIADEDADWESVEEAVGEAIDREPIEEDTLDDLIALFGIAVEAGIAGRERESERVTNALREAYNELSEPLPELEEQPIALLPVRLETRFVDEDGGRGFVEDDIDPEQLLVRVYPDQVHVDAHESELTEDEVEWGTYFWTVLWFARHPDPEVMMEGANDYLEERIPDGRLRAVVGGLVGDVAAGKFSEEHYDRYRELKERAWKKLLNRFGRERAAFIVHSLEPTDGNLALDLLTAPPEPPDDGDDRPVGKRVHKAEGQLVAREVESPDVIERPVEDEVDVIDEPEDELDVEEPVEEELDVMEESVEEDEDEEDDDGTRPRTRVRASRGERSDRSERARRRPRSRSRIVRDHRAERPAVGRAETAESDDEADEADEELPELPERLPPLAFPEVPRRPESWTKSARAKLLPDRWVAIAEWEDAGGTSHRTAVAGEAIRDPLQVGPGLESVAEELLSATRESDSPAAEGTEWLVDFREAEEVGMALRIPLGALAGFDHHRGFDRLSVVGVKASMTAAETPDALADLLDAHHYTDGLSFVEQGTPTSNHDLPSGYSRTEDPLKSMEVECVPPKVESGDRSDGDLLARALAIDHGVGTDHVFANVANAGGTEQRDARHMNSALWPATLGYSLQHVLVDNRFAGNPSLWGDRDDDGGPTVNTHLLWLDAYRRHFVRYVRGRGPFPALRIGAHPYGVLPTTAVETERDLSVLEPSLLPDLLGSRVDLDGIRDRGYDLEDLAAGGIDPELLVDAGARADAVIEAGAETSHLVRRSIREDDEVSQERIAPPELTRDGIGLTATSKLSADRLEAVGIDTDRLASAEITPGDLARGAVTDDRLEEKDVTVEQLAEAVLREEVKKLGITPEAVARAGVGPSALLRGEFSDRDVESLALDTRAVAEVVLPRELKRAGVTPKTLQDAGVSPEELLNGEVDNTTLRAAGIDFATIVEALVPEELSSAGITPARLSEAGVTLAELFNGTVTDEALRSVGITTDAVADTLLPIEMREVGATAVDLEDARITPAAVLNGTVTPADLRDAGISPETLAEVGVLPEVLTALGDGLGEFISAGLDPETLLSNGVTARTLTDAGIDPETLLEAGLTREHLEEAGVDPSPAVEVETDETDEVGPEPDPVEDATGADRAADALSGDVLYARPVTEALDRADRELYRFSFDPATPRVGPRSGANDVEGGWERTEEVSKRIASTRSVEDGGVEGSDGPLQNGGTRLVTPALLDTLVRDRLRERVSGFSAHWSAAAAELPFTSDVDEDALLDLLKRTGVSSDVRHRTMIYSGEDHGTDDPVGSEVADLLLPGHRWTIRDALEVAGATDLDPRIGSLYPFDADSTEQLDPDGKFPIFSHFKQYHGRVGSPHRGIVSPHDDVDADIATFIDIMRDRSWRAIDQLSHPLDLWQGMRTMEHVPYEPSYPRVGLDFDPIDLSRQEWDRLGMLEQRKRFVEEIETSDDPIDLVERMVAESRGTDKPTIMAENAADFGDSGVLRSFLRILLQFGTLQAYVTARRRIGAEFGDHPDGWPEPSLWADERGPLDSLDDPVPPALALRPDVESEMSYGDVLRIAAREDPSTTSIDPRMSEYTDSLAYLRDCDPASLAAAMHETLDLANHRLDAWWTSIATKDLLELREVQGTDGDGLDAMSWAGPGGDVQLTTMEPALSGSFFGDSDASEREEEGDGSRTSPDGGEEESDRPRRRARRRDHRMEDKEQGSDEPSDDTEEEPDRPRRQVRARRRSSERVRDHRTEDEERGSNEPSDDDTQDEPDHDPDSLLRRAEDDPGLYVGGYGFVEELRPNLDEETGPEYIHTPSEGHATTAALLRSGLDAHAADEGENVMGVDLSPERVRAGLWLIRGVRRGGSLGQLLGFRFERRLHEETLADAEELDREEVDLMQYLRAFRSTFPAIVDKIERPDEPKRSDGDRRKAELAGSDTVDGYRLVKRWDRYPFGRGDELPDPDDDATEYAVLKTIVEELRTAVHAAGDLLTAESVHQLGQGNFEQVGGSIDALAKGEAFPDPTVVQTPRTNTGFPHRHCVLLDAAEDPPIETPRSRAEPAIATWVQHLLPDPDAVECRATIHWTDADDEPRSVSTTVMLSELELGPLDTLYLFGSDAEGSRAELESLLVYRLLRDPPDGAVPADATVEVTLAETEREDATSVAAVLEFARSLRTLVQESRPMRADDLTHPTEARGPGYDDATLDAMSERTRAAWTGLYTWAEVIDERLALLDANHAIGDAIAGLPHPDGAEPAVDGTGSDGGWEALAGDPLVPGSGSPAARGDPDDGSTTVTGQVDGLVEAAESVHEEVPLSQLRALAESVDTDELENELRTLSSSLPVGPTTRSAVRESVTVRSSADATITGAVGEGLTDPSVPEVGTAADGPTAEVDTGSFLTGAPAGFDAPPSDSSPSDGNDEGTVTVTLWGTDGSGWFEREASAPVDADGTFAASIDLSSVAPGTPFTVAAESEGEVVYAADGRVVRDGPGDGSDPGEVLATRCPNLRRLLWILDASDVLEKGEDGPLGTLTAAFEATDWERIAEERERMEPDGTVLTDADLAAVDALLALGDVDPELLSSAVLRLADPVSRTGLHDLFLVAGEDPDADGSIRYMQRPTITEVRARLHRLLEGPALADEGHPSRLLAYDPRIARQLADRSDGPAVAVTLDAFLAASGWVLRYFAREDVEAIPLVAGLTAWLYDPDAVDDPGALATRLRTLSTSVDEYPGLAALFEGLPSEGESSAAAAFATHLETVAELVEEGAAEFPDDTDGTIASDRSAAGELSAATDELERAIDGVVSGEPVNEAFRECVLESLRGPMATVARYGVLGATPRPPAGGTPDAERQLREQARTVLRRVHGRLAEMEPPDEEDALEARVGTEVNRLETLFGDGFVVLPPFAPTNPGELRATFTSEGLVPDGRELAAETWLQRAAAVRDRIDDFREARTYGEVLTGTHAPPLTIGQVPYEPGDTWVGVDGVDPPPGRLSLVAGFGPALDPEGVDGRMVGLFVDEWHESVPEETETTGVALHYDDPGNRAPNSVLLVPPPPDKSLSLSDLAAAIAETGEWARRRAVDYGDMDGIDHLLPGLYLPVAGARGRQPLVDLRMLDWYDWTAVDALLEPAFFRDQVVLSDGADTVLGGGDG